MVVLSDLWLDLCLVLVAVRGRCLCGPPAGLKVQAMQRCPPQPTLESIS